MLPFQPVAGILLAGGRSSRMGGGDKCLRQLGGRPILTRIVERLRPQVSIMVINANGEPSRFAAFDLPIAADSVTGFAGPLAGVHAGLEWVRANCPGIPHAVTLATDTPFFPLDLVRRFLSEQGDHPKLLVARSNVGTHPVVGLWPVDLAPALAASLKAGERKAGKWVAEHGAVEVFFPDIEIGGVTIDPFFNINRPGDLSHADDILREQTR